MSLPVDAKANSETEHLSPASIFTLKYALERYEPLSLTTAIYRPSVRRQIELYGGIGRGDVILDLGCGTGNSTFEIAQSNPAFGEIHAIDPSPALEVARYKFGKTDPAAWSAMVEGIEVPDFVQKRIEEQRALTAAYSERVSIHSGTVENLRLLIPGILADGAFAVQALHWMAYGTDDVEGNDISYLKKSIQQIRQSLKDGGLFVFDESGFQFDHGDLEYEGKNLNSLHPINHPFHEAFITNLNLTFTSAGIDMQVDPRRVDRYHRMFTFPLLSALLKDSGFRIIPTPEGNPYEIGIYSKDADGIVSFIKNGGAMRYFAKPEVQELPDNLKSQLIDSALAATLTENGNLLSQPAAETLAFFKVQAV